MPAEWAPQSGVQLTWPDGTTDWQPYLGAITKTYIELADAITRKEHLVIAASDPDAVRACLEKVLSDEQMRRTRIYHCEINDTWARDHGALTMIDKDGNAKLLDFKFNGWGEKFAWEKDNAITMSLYRQGSFRGTLENHGDFVLEGGSIESDGQGTIFTTAQCLLAPHRNQPLEQADIEAKLKDFFDVRRIVWLHHGNLKGDDTDGHIDTIARICPNDTILYVGCRDKNDEQYSDFIELEDELVALKTIDGRPYRLLRLPMPTAMYDEDYRLPATYANFLVINGAVIMPTYGQEDNDKLARKTIAEAFPGREIIEIDASTVVRQHGSLHCLTMQYPEGVIK